MSQIVLNKLAMSRILPNVIVRLACSQQAKQLASSPFNLFPTSTNKHPTNQTRNLCSEAHLGLAKLDAWKENRIKLYMDGKDRYIERLAQFLKQGETKSIFKDDLINLIAFAENTEHLDMIEQVSLISSDPNNLSFGAWGSAVMRLYYKMNQIDRAYNNVKNVEKFGEFFNQRMTYMILMTMLFNAGRYEQVIEINQMATDRLNSIQSKTNYVTDRSLTVIAFAAYCKINSPEALSEATKLYAKDPNNPNMKARVVSFLSYLAVKQNEPVIALNTLSDHPHKNYISARELKTMALVQLKRHEDILYHLKDCLASTRRDISVILKNSYDIIMENSNEIEDEHVKNEIVRTLTELKEENLVSEDSLDNIVFKEINRVPRDRENNNLSAGQNRRFNTNYDKPHYNDRDSYGHNASRGGRNFSGNENRFQKGGDDHFGDREGGRPQMQSRRNWVSRNRRDSPRSYFEDDLDNIEDEIVNNRQDQNKRFR